MRAGPLLPSLFELLIYKIVMILKLSEREIKLAIDGLDVWDGEYSGTKMYEEFYKTQVSKLYKKLLKLISSK